MKILLVKLSSLGDVVHTLPVVQDIRAALPDAQIDWVLEKSLAPFLQQTQSLQRVIACEIRRWRKSPLTAVTRREWRAFRAELQMEAYDAVIDLQGLSKSALVARLARLAPGGKRYALANQTEGSGYEAPTRWLADVAIPMEPHIHAVQRSRELAARALGYSLQSSPDFGLKVPVAHSLRAQEAITNIATSMPRGMLAFVHGTSRADKEWPLQHWVELGQRFNAVGVQIALPHGTASELATSEAIASALNGSAKRAELHNTGHDTPQAWPPARVLPRLALDALTQQLANCVGVIGVDSGVSHIAVALDLPHVQIYNFDTAWRTGPLDAAPRQVSVFAKPSPSVDAVWQAWLACSPASEGPNADAPANADHKTAIS